MKNCPQTETQSVFEHGQSVQRWFLKLFDVLHRNHAQSFRMLPDWLDQYRKFILSKLLPLNIIKEYTLFHDVGKPHCLTYIDGKRHFPNHAQVSADVYRKAGGNEQVAKLIELDMVIHQIKACELPDFIKLPEAITLLIVGLGEVLSNAELFGGFDSDSFKIKLKQINRRGCTILKKLSGEIK